MDAVLERLLVTHGESDIPRFSWPRLRFKLTGVCEVLVFLAADPDHGARASEKLRRMVRSTIPTATSYTTEEVRCAAERLGAFSDAGTWEEADRRVGQRLRTLARTSVPAQQAPLRFVAPFAVPLPAAPAPGADLPAADPPALAAAHRQNRRNNLKQRLAAARRSSNRWRERALAAEQKLRDKETS